MITRKMEEKFEELKYYFNTKMFEQEENLAKVFNNALNIFEKRPPNKFKMKLKVTASIWNLKTKS